MNSKTVSTYVLKNACILIHTARIQLSHVALGCHELRDVRHQLGHLPLPREVCASPPLLVDVLHTLEVLDDGLIGAAQRLDSEGKQERRERERERETEGREGGGRVVTGLISTPFLPPSLRTKGTVDHKSDNGER